MISMQRAVATAATLAGLALANAPAHAQVKYHTVSLAGRTNATFCGMGMVNCGLFPSGSQTLGGVPFAIDRSGSPAQTRGWFGHAAANFGAGTVSLTIPVGVYGVRDVYTLMNSFWGERTPGTLASIRFLGTGGLDYLVPLDGNVDLRDYNYNPSFSQTLAAPHAQVFNNNRGQWLDRQQFVLPTAFASQTLTSIVLTDAGNAGVQRVLLTGVTVASVPEPATVALMATGLALVAAAARRRRTR